MFKTLVSNKKIFWGGRLNNSTGKPEKLKYSIWQWIFRRKLVKLTDVFFTARRVCYLPNKVVI